MLLEAARAFVPAAVVNNAKGKDAEILKKFRERSWNNPVVRFLDKNEKDILPRLGGIYSLKGLVRRMTKALASQPSGAPAWLRNWSWELNPKAREQATFAMYCYWTGEKQLGAIPGVLATRIGMLGRFEVVDLDFDPTVVSYLELVEAAQKLKCAGRVFTRTDVQQDIAQALVGKAAVRSDDPVNTRTRQQVHLASRKDYHLLPLTPLQATRVNAEIARKQDPQNLLSPGQLRLLARIQKALARDKDHFKWLVPDRSWKGLPAYWKALRERLAKLDSDF